MHMTFSDSEKTRSLALQTFVIEQIQKAGGHIPFSTFMHHVLYTPELGYYMTHHRIFGSTEESGDFTTAPEISSLFGETLAQICHKILKEMPQAVILEFGAGSGKLAVDLLKTLETLGTPPEAYWILDPSPTLQKKQQQTVDTHLPTWKEKICWLKKLPEKPFVGIIIANEVLDAMPAQRFQVTHDNCFEIHVKYQNECFQDDYQSTDDPNILALARNIRANTSLEELKKTSYQSERIPALKSFFQELFSSLEQGVVLLMDYGFPRHELYHPDRHMGTLMCHYHQRVHTNPYQHIGLQDITTHVDFTDAAEQATDAGFELAGYTQQAAFLMNAGLLSLLQEKSPSINDKTAVYLLTSPSEMGELFKVMALTKNMTKNVNFYPFPGFELFDKRHTL